MSANTVCHIEFEVEDLAKARAFYESVFGWTFREFGETMVVFGTDAGHIGGLHKATGPVQKGNSPSVWFEVENIDATMAKVREAGGTTPSDKGNTPHVGFTVLAFDPEGNPFGLVQFVREGA